MDIGLIRSFIQNRTVLGLLVGACFIVTALDLYIDSSQSIIVNSAALQVAKNSEQILDEFNEHTIESLQNKFKDSKAMSLRFLSQASLKDQFEKDAYASLTKDPNKPFYEVQSSDNRMLMRYASTSGNAIIELDIPLDELQAVAGSESTKTLWVLITLAILSSASLAIFFAYLRRSSEVLIETQRKALEYQKQLTWAYGRFFPHQFLDLLKKDSVLDINLGDQVEKRMAVVFSDIRDFTSIVEKLTPAESFQMINNYLRDVGPIIRNHNGFIDKYIGDAIMALFDNPDNAIDATLNIMKLLKEFASSAPQSGFIIREVGVGLHYGPLMVGTVGEIERMDGTVISDVVNTSSRLESLNKAYGTNIILSEQFLEKLTVKDKLKIRFIDHIVAKGKKEGIKIYEVYNIDSPEIIEKKDRILGDFEKAMSCYQNRKFQEAKSYLQNCKKIYPQDVITDLFLHRCERLIADPPGEKWVPIAKLSQKDEVD